MLRFIPVFLLLSCATTPPSPPAPIGPPLPRTSISAVLEHRDELKFTDEQVGRLEAIEDRQLAKLDEMRAAHAAANGQPAPPPRSGGGRGGMGSGGRRGGGGMGMGGMGGMGGSPPQRRERPPEEVLNKIDDLDTQTFMEAIELFTVEQKEPAIQIASKYRAQLFERRQRHRSDE